MMFIDVKNYNKMRSILNIVQVNIKNNDIFNIVKFIVQEPIFMIMLFIYPLIGSL